MSIFNSVPVTRIARSMHNLSHQNKCSFDAGKLIPIMTEFALPGDSWRVGLEQFVRTMPMIAPVMDMMDIKVDAFFVPLRLIWDDWEDYITLGLTGEFTAEHPTLFVDIDTVDSTHLQYFNPVVGVGGLADYLNFATTDLPTIGNSFYREFDALPFRAYQTIYNEYYLNENLDDPLLVDHSSGALRLHSFLDPSELGDLSHFVLKNRGWRKDYFTSALPSPQKGPAVRIPTSDLVTSIGPDGKLVLQSADPEDHPLPTPAVKPSGSIEGVFTLDHEAWPIIQTDDDPDDPAYAELAYKGGLKALSTQITPPTIEELRYAETLQEYYEANARGGTRYKEHLLNIWHTRSKDSRLDRPEYLGGYRGPITITDIDQTSQSATTPQGTLAGKGMSVGGNRLFKYHVPEYGIIMVIMSVQPKSSYYQGDRRWNLYRDVFDIPNPFFANLGEQEIFNQELFYSADETKDKGTFGYAPRYSEAKYIPSSVHGQFRSTLDYWHLARKFSELPNLNGNFVHVDPSEVSRIFPNQVNTNDKFVGTFFFHVKRKTYLPYWGVPRLIHSV